MKDIGGRIAVGSRVRPKRGQGDRRFYAIVTDCYKHGAVSLDRRLDGCHWWNIDALVKVKVIR